MIDDFTRVRWRKLAQRYIDTQLTDGVRAAILEAAKDLQVGETTDFLEFLVSYGSENGYKLRED